MANVSGVPAGAENEGKEAALGVLPPSTHAACQQCEPTHPVTASAPAVSVAPGTSPADAVAAGAVAEAASDGAFVTVVVGVADVAECWVASAVAALVARGLAGVEARVHPTASQRVATTAVAGAAREDGPVRLIDLLLARVELAMLHDFRKRVSAPTAARRDVHADDL